MDGIAEHPLPVSAQAVGPWRVRPFEEGDERAILPLWEAVFGHPLSLAHYRWKVLETPERVAGGSVWVAAAGERVVGHYAATPLRFKLGAAERVILHTCDAATAADVRKAGVFSAVAGAAHEAWKAAGVPFLIGLPHEGWGSRRAFLGYQTMFQARWFTCPLRVDRLLLRRSALALPLRGLLRLAAGAWHGLLQRRAGGARKSVRVRGVEAPLAEWDDLWDRLKGGYEALVVRDRRWIAYRYASAPDRSYRLLLASRDDGPCGYLVYRVTGGAARTTGWIVDLLTAPGDSEARAALLGAAMDALFQAGAGTVQFLLPVASPLLPEVRRAGFFPRRGSYDVSVVPLADPLPPAALHDASRWYLMGGDFDIV